jgi:hypothetical protein
MGRFLFVGRRVVRLAIISFFLLFAVLVGGVNAGEVREVELNDGSVIQAEIVSLSGGIYTLKSNTLGTVKIDKSKIQSIRLKSSGEPPLTQGSPALTHTDPQVQVFQQLMMGDKEIMSMILSLLNDPEVQAILEDPSIIKAVNSGDVDALLSNPKFMKLMDNPTVRDITRKTME